MFQRKAEARVEMAWGSGELKSCESLISRVELNDPTLKELVVLPMKTFGGSEVERLASILESGKNTHLTLLAASGHSVSPVALGRLGAVIASGKCNLVGLAIGDQKMGDAGVAALCASLESVNGGKLAVLDLAWKDISSAGMMSLGKTFGLSKHLKQLVLSRNEEIGDDGVRAFYESLSDANNASIMESLETLDLAACNLGPLGMEALTKILTNCPKRHLALTLTSNPLKAGSSASISTLLCGTSRIRLLYLAHCEIGDTGVEQLSASIECEKCIGLSVLDLSHNGIGPEGANKLALVMWRNGINHLENLVELVLAGNNLGHVGVQSLVQALVHKTEDGNLASGNSTLTSLDLTQTNCGNDGAVAILRCTALKKVRLFNNKLGNSGFIAIARELRGGHVSIEQLDVGGNNATKEGVIGVIDAVGTILKEIDSKLNTLEVGGNETGFEVEEAIKRMKTTRPGLDVARDKPRPQQNEVDSLHCP